MTYRPLLLLLWVLGILAPACQTNQPTSWQLKMPPDTVYHFVARSIAIPDVRRARQDTTATWFNLRCTYQDDSLLTLQLGVEKLERTEPAIALFMPGKSVAEMNKMNRDWMAFKDSCRQGVINDSLVVSCTRRGELISVRGVEEIMRKIARTTGHDSRDVYSNLEDIFSTKALEDLLKQCFFYISNRPLQAGENWVNNYTLKAKAPVKYSNLIILKQVQGDTVELDVKTAVSAWTGEGGRIFAKGDQWGKVLASRATGMPYYFSLEDTLVTKTDYYNITSRRIFTLQSR